jgi:hypothetical protein
MLGNYRVAAQLVASRAVLSSTELVSFSYMYMSPKNLVTNPYHFYSQLSPIFSTDRTKQKKKCYIHETLVTVSAPY